MRTYDVIQADIRQASSINDAVALHALVTEMQALGTPQAEASAFNALGTVSFLISDYPQALEHYRRALAAHEHLGDRAGAANVTCNMGNVHSQTGAYPQALEHYRQALALHEELGNRAGAALVTGNMGGVYYNTGDYWSALEHFQRALDVYEELGIHAGVAIVTSNMIMVLMKLDRYDEAAVLLETQAGMTLENPAVRAEHFASRAAVAEHLGDLDAANDHLQNALAITVHVGLRDSSAEYHEKLRDLAQKRNDFAGFIEHNAEYLRITEEIRGKEATQRLTMMEAERKMEGERREREKERALLYGALPKSVADRMIRGDDVSGDHFDHAAVMFLDIVGFTTHTSDLPPGDVVKLLEHIFSTIDRICDTHNVVKIKTIGDSYMCFRGDADVSTNAISIARVGIEAMQVASGVAFMWPLGGRIQFRIGVHIGTATAGVIGTQRLQYDVWGDTVNVASRMESSSEPGRIHVSEAFAEVLRSSTDPVPYTLIQRGAVEIKGKGAMMTYWLEEA